MGFELQTHHSDNSSLKAGGLEEENLGRVQYIVYIIYA